jgi:hypothetical protein
MRWATIAWGIPIVLLKVAQFVAITLAALALVPSGAHLSALGNKISLGAEQYFIVQNIYRGWDLFGTVLVGSLVADLVLALMLRRRGGAPLILALLALGAIVLMLAIFFLWTFPANQATNNWTTIPGHWEQLREQWEYSHAVNAVVAFVAFCSVTLSALMTRE